MHQELGVNTDAEYSPEAFLLPQLPTSATLQNADDSLCLGDRNVTTTVYSAEWRLSGWNIRIVSVQDNRLYGSCKRSNIGFSASPRR